MYRIDNKSAAISEVQRLLQINQTGTFDKNTINSVAEHQNKNNIEPTGIVDYVTFLSILSAYKAKKSEEIGHTPLAVKKDFPAYPGSQKPIIEHVNFLLGNIIQEYRLNIKIPYGKYYGYDTTNAIYAVQKIFGLIEKDVIDSTLYNRILQENEAITVKKHFQ